jgi:hypothetical protein
VEAAHELLVKDRDLSVKDERVRAQLSDPDHELWEASRVVDGVTGDQPDILAVLISDHAPTVDFLFVDPAFAVEGRPRERRRHGGKRAGDQQPRSLSDACQNGAGIDD